MSFKGKSNGSSMAQLSTNMLGKSLKDSIDNNAKIENDCPKSFDVSFLTIPRDTHLNRTWAAVAPDQFSAKMRRVSQTFLLA